jgi:molecular chaperone GrpE
MGGRKKKYKTKKELEEELKEKTELVDQYLDHIKRLKADFENYKKRVEKEKATFIKSAEGGLVRELLPVLDNFERAINHLENTPHSTFSEGIKLINKELLEILKKRGLRRLEVVGQPFNPTFHEAVLQEESSEYEEGVIIKEVQPGYKFGEILLRPAQVIISKGKKDGGEGKDG